MLKSKLEVLAEYMDEHPGDIFLNHNGVWVSLKPIPDEIQSVLDSQNKANEYFEEIAPVLCKCLDELAEEGIAYE